MSTGHYRTQRNTPARRHLMGWKNTKQHPETPVTQHTAEYLLFTLAVAGCLGAGSLPPPSVAREDPTHISPAREKIKIPNLKYSFY